MVNSKVYMVTGATSGLGKAVALELAKTGETVIMVARDGDHGGQVLKEVTSTTQNSNIDLQLCDLGNLLSVRNLATIVNNRYEKIDVLINNSSVYRKDREVSVDGYESMFATNYLGPFLLTYLLRDRLLASGSARIINITAPSTAELDFNNLHGEQNFDPSAIFDATQMANLLFTFELARRMENSGVRVNALDTGLGRSTLTKEESTSKGFLSSLFSSSPHHAAEEVIRVATAAEFENTNGKFIQNGKDIGSPAYALDPAVQMKLWDMSEKLTDASNLGPNYDPTGSKSIHNKEEIPEGLIRTEDTPTKDENVGRRKRNE